MVVWFLSPSVGGYFFSEFFSWRGKGGAQKRKEKIFLGGEGEQTVNRGGLNFFFFFSSKSKAKKKENRIR